MATAEKTTAAAEADPTAIESASDEGLVAPRAIFVMSRGSADTAEASSSAAKDSVVPAAPAAEIQESFRSALERGMTESRAAFAKAKTAADDTTSAFEVSFAAAQDGARAINAKAFEALRANADANFDFLKAMFAAKSLSDVITLQTEFASRQVETMTNQTKDLGALTQKAMADAVEPIKEQVAKSFRIAV
jgi:phasin